MLAKQHTAEEVQRTTRSLSSDSVSDSRSEFVVPGKPLVSEDDLMGLTPKNPTRFNLDALKWESLGARAS